MRMRLLSLTITFDGLREEAVVRLLPVSAATALGVMGRGGCIDRERLPKAP